MKKFLLIVIFLTLALLGSVFVYRHERLPFAGQNSQDQSLTSVLKSLPDKSLIFADLGGNTFQLEVVNAPRSITKGLSGREEIGSDGMLFVLPQPDIHGFWMLDMKFDLDLVWFFQGEIIGFELNASRPKESSSKLPIYQPGTPSDMVLEVKAGFVERYELKIGDRLTLLSDFQPEGF